MSIANLAETRTLRAKGPWRTLVLNDTGRRLLL